MAGGSEKFHSSVLFLFIAVCVLFGKSTGALTPTESGLGEIKYSRSSRSVPEPTASPPGVRLHPGLLASVVIVAIVAIVAAVLILKKYCFPQSDATYRYSVLRRMEEQREEESDEDLLE